MSKHLIIAIDGTAGSGKSTIARGIAKILGFLYLDTGAMYRALTYKIINEHINYQDNNLLKQLLNHTTIEFEPENNKILLDGKDVTKSIRGEKIDALVSQISAIPEVREKMVKEQRRIAQNQNIIVEGRDIGSIVFPNADLKFYLDCSIEQRAIRRQKELLAQSNSLPKRSKYEPISNDLIKKNLMERDFLDSNRKISPLRKMPDAIYIDTTNLTIDEEIQSVVNRIRDYIANCVKEDK